MKLRILDNSIRLRLKRTEVKSLLSAGIVARETRIAPGERLRYEIASERDSTAIVTTFRHGVIRIAVPTAFVDQWANSATVGLESIQHDGTGDLKVLIEKDFQCAHHEDDAPNDKFSPELLAV